MVKPSSASPKGPPRGRPFTVGEVMGQIRECLDDNFQPLLVRGEVCDLRQPRSGHVYLTLRDRVARLRVVVFASTRRRIPHALKDGEDAMVWGRITAYPAGGQVQLVADWYEVDGQGARWEQRERLRKKLAAEGLFAQERKRPLPRVPQVVGVVTSTSGSAIHDVKTTLARRFPGARVVIAPTTVQGAAAAVGIAAAIRALDERGGVDVLLIVRGGGSQEDLACFDDEAVVRAIAASKTPVVCGVGHEDDVTLADLVADLRAPTPTGAAEVAVPVRTEMLAALDERALRLEAAMRGRLVTARASVRLAANSHAMRAPVLAVRDLAQRLDDAQRRLELLAPRARLVRRREQLIVLERRLAAAGSALTGGRRDALREAAARLPRAAALRLERDQQRLAACAGRIHSLSPLRVLARGYSLTTREDGTLVQNADDVQEGDVVLTRLAEGMLRARVVDVCSGGASPPQFPPSTFQRGEGV